MGASLRRQAIVRGWEGAITARYRSMAEALELQSTGSKARTQIIAQLEDEIWRYREALQTARFELEN